MSFNIWSDIFCLSLATLKKEAISSSKVHKTVLSQKYYVEQWGIYFLAVQVMFFYKWRSFEIF